MTTLAGSASQVIYHSVAGEEEEAEKFKRRVEEVVEKTRFTKLHTEKRRAERARSRQRKKLSSTVETEHTSGATLATSLWDHLCDDNFDAFHNAKKVPSLRKSPAHVMWPSRPVTNTLSRPRWSIKQLSTDSEEVEETVEPPSREGRKNREKDDAATGRDPGRMDSHGVIHDEKAYVPVYSDFWQTAVGSLRIDSLGIGAPRADPHHSTWERPARKCFFLSPLSKPPHQREPFFRHAKNPEVSKKSGIRRASSNKALRKDHKAAAVKEQGSTNRTHEIGLSRTRDLDLGR